MTFQTSVATKAARCVLAGDGAQLVDFSFRRTQGIDAGLSVARTSAMRGFAATSNLEAARRYGLAAAGTMAHSFIEAFADEEQAFTAFAEDFPGKTTFLVDTYDTERGIRAAIAVARRMRLRPPVGVRLDSGDLADLARLARGLLDAAGLPDARIFASGSLDEFAIADLVAGQVPIDAYGVGTKMGVCADAPYLDSAYELVACGAGRPVMKLSPGKIAEPGDQRSTAARRAMCWRSAASPRRPATSRFSSPSCAAAGAWPRASRYRPPSAGAPLTWPGCRRRPRPCGRPRPYQGHRQPAAHGAAGAPQPGACLALRSLLTSEPACL